MQKDRPLGRSFYAFTLQRKTCGIKLLGDCPYFSLLLRHAHLPIRRPKHGFIAANGAAPLRAGLFFGKSLYKDGTLLLLTVGTTDLFVLVPHCLRCSLPPLAPQKAAKYLLASFNQWRKRSFTAVVLKHLAINSGVSCFLPLRLPCFCLSAVRSACYLFFSVSACSMRSLSAFFCPTSWYSPVQTSASSPCIGEKNRFRAVFPHKNRHGIDLSMVCTSNRGFCCHCPCLSRPFSPSLLNNRCQVRGVSTANRCAVRAQAIAAGIFIRFIAPSVSLAASCKA